MPCDTADHTHVWPRSGQLYIEGCERYCGYCTNPRCRQFASTATLRSHVKGFHAAIDHSHPNVTSVVAGTTCFQDGDDTRAAMQAGGDVRIPLIQHILPTDALVTSQQPWIVMLDIHSQLHLRTQAIDALHLFLWRHILSKPIANLAGLARAVKPDMITVPDDLLNPIVTFLNGCGDIIWPSLAASRHHLLKSSRSLEYGYWTSHDTSGACTGPVWLRDGFMTPNVRHQWEQNNDGSEPPSDVNVINSALGRLIKIYVFAMLQHSLVNPFGYQTAARVEPAELLRRILEVDQDEVRKGPIGEAMRLNRDKSGKTVEEMVMQYRAETGYKGGLP